MRWVKVVGVGALMHSSAAVLAGQGQVSQVSSPTLSFAPVLQVASQGADAETTDDGEQIAAVVVVGNEAIDDLAFRSAMEEFFGAELNAEMLAELTNEVEQLARDKGYEYARAEIVGDPDQFGIVEVKIDEGVINAVEIEGHDNPLARRILEKLIGNAIHKGELERALLLVSDIPSVRLRGARFKRDNGQGVLAVRLTKRDARIRVSGDNYGSDSFGPYRMRGSVSSGAVLASGDAARASVRINPVELDELLFFSAGYETAIGTDGLRFGLSGSIGTTAPGGQFEDSDISGDSVSASANLTYPLLRSKSASVWAEARAGYISIEQDDLGSLLRDDTVVTASIGLRTQFAVAGGRIRSGISHVRGLDMFGATRLGDSLASRIDGDGVFSKIEFWSDARFPIVEDVSVLFALGGQLADRPLLSTEELGLGGAYRTRGYNFSEVLGDEAIYGLAELRYAVPKDAIPLDYLQFYAYADGGYVSDIGQDFGEGSLFSAGAGIRARLGDVDVEVESGFPLGGSGERRETDGPEINVRAGVNF